MRSGILGYKCIRWTVGEFQFHYESSSVVPLGAKVVYDIDDWFDVVRESLLLG